MGSTTVDDAGILIVDDEASVVRVLELFLKSEGYTNVATTTRPRLALPLLEELGIDLLVLDLHMPDLSGFDIIEQLGAAATSEPVSAMIITSDVSSNVRERASQSGIEVVAKPFQVDEILGRIRRMLERRLHDPAPQEVAHS
jgi:putative two-component system response regulator